MEENDRRNYFMINLHKSMGLGRDQTRYPESAVRLASVARHVTHCAKQPSDNGWNINCLKLIYQYKNSH